MMWVPKPTRRDFIRAMGLATGAGSLALIGCNRSGTTPPTPGPVDPGPGPGPSEPGIVTRRNITSAGAAGDLELYKQAVQAMKALPASDPTSWQAQARIHLDFCPHSNAFFLPWHRAYLHYFEDVIRGVLNDQSFALPYWDWTTHPSLPDPFWQGSLNDPTRTIAPGQEIPARYVGPSVITGILDIADFETFGSRYVTDACASEPFQRSRCGTGELEGVPHNNVHNLIGGNMATFMSPLDPIFWVHHCNVDRLWAEWNKSHQNGTFEPWRSFVFADNFVNAAGQPQSISVQETFDTTALGYKYDGDATRAAAPVGATGTVVATVSAENTAKAAVGSALRIPVELSSQVLDSVMSAASGAARTGSGRQSVRLVLNSVPTPNQPLAVNVYLGDPDGAHTQDSANFVRSFGFFPIGEQHHGHGGDTTFLFDISDDLGRLGEQRWGSGEQLSVHVESVPLYTGAAAIDEAVAPTSVQVEIVDVS